MRVINYFESDKQEQWLAQIAGSDWSAGPFLAKLLRENRFFEAVGAHSRVLLLIEGDNLISYCAFAEKDDIQPTRLTPWLGFVYTFPDYRGHRYAGKLFEEAERLAKEENIPQIYLSTNHVGLYEKYGFEYDTMLKDMDGEPSRIYMKKIKTEGNTVLETERLCLRHWEESDAEDLFRYASDPAVGPAAGWPPHTSVEQSREVIKNVLSGSECYAVCLKEENKPIGAVELLLGKRLAQRENECELGYWVAKPFWGQGLIPEAARELLRRAFEELNMQTVWCGYYDGNEKSHRVQQKLGFIYRYTNENADVPLLHETRTEHIAAMTKEEWLNHE